MSEPARQIWTVDAGRGNVWIRVWPGGYLNRAGSCAVASCCQLPSRAAISARLLTCRTLAECLGPDKSHHPVATAPTLPPTLRPRPNSPTIPPTQQSLPPANLSDQLQHTTCTSTLAGPASRLSPRPSALGVYPAHFSIACRTCGSCLDKWISRLTIINYPSIVRTYQSYSPICLSDSGDTRT